VNGVNIAFCDGMLLQLDLSTSSPTIVSKQGIGTATIDFYNYFSRYRSSPKEEFLNLLSRPDKEVLEIISEQSLANQFFLDYASSRQGISVKNQQNATKEALTYTCNLIQSAFSDLNAAFSERSNVNKANTPQSNNLPNLFKVDKFAASFVLLDNKIVLVYTVNSLCEYLKLDFYHANLSPDSVKHVSICPYCGKAFRMSQRNNLYCSKACKDKSIRANNKKSPYYSKYRYLQQYHNRQLNRQRSQMADSLPKIERLQNAYDTWNKWARTEYEQATRVYNCEQQKEQESVENFGERLKKKWKALIKSCS
jgi:hypothetical protein